ncbi:uncharacterized protein ALTATR162_LOCUS2394 [Alternaria atra]|uniref:Uncharacterized protein n=1 Tax=Alternaria atra TaxID=119953 RepID=A0A8J2HYI1_9PLEO|nr:uncharacterized protein ALTATR162_LOCUS2394 [Alternaria atra]CAG5149556.1 unnamed protein product [Alternaria atra]
MALAILPAIIVSFVVLVGLLGTYYICQAYRRVRFAVPDVERTRDIENVEHFKQQIIQLRDVELPHQQYHSVGKPLPHIPEIEYTGGEGLVSPPERVFLSIEEVKESSKGTAGEISNFQKLDLHAGRPWNSVTDGYGNSLVEQPELLSPKPVRKVTRKLKAVPANTAYDPAQTVAADIWEKIHKGELQPSRRKPEKKLPKSSNAPIPEVLRDSAEFENDALQDIDLGSSTKEWAKVSVSSAYVTKRPIKRGSFDSVTTVVDANNVSIERPTSYVKHKQSMDTEAVMPRQSLDRAAKTRRKILDARNQMAERKKQEEKERQAEERRQAEEQEERAAEQQRLVEENRRQKDEERARSLAQVTQAENVDLYDTNDSGAQLHSTRRRSNTSTVSKRERKAREKPLMRSPKRANTFANDVTPSAHSSMSDKKPGGSSNGTSRSMSMNEQARPDFNTTVTSIAEGGYADNSVRMRDAGNSRTIEAFYAVLEARWIGVERWRKMFVAEPEEMSESEDGDGHGDWERQEEERKDSVRMRGGAGEKTVESGCESGAGTEEDDESDADEVEHSGNDHSESEYLENERSESEDDTEEHDSSEDRVSEDDAPEDEHSESEVSNDEASDAGTSDDESGEKGSDYGHEQALSQTPV